jgi:hypothetical protein
MPPSSVTKALRCAGGVSPQPGRIGRTTALHLRADCAFVFSLSTFLVTVNQLLKIEEELP